MLRSAQPYKPFISLCIELASRNTNTYQNNNNEESIIQRMDIKCEVYLFVHNNQHLVFDRKVAHVNALTGRHAFCRRVTACVTGSVFKAQMMRDVQLDITGKQSEVVLEILTDTNLQAAVKEEGLQRRASLILDYSLVFAKSRGTSEAGV